MRTKTRQSEKVGLDAWLLLRLLNHLRKTMIALTKLVEARAGKVAKLTGSGGYRRRILLEKILEDGLNQRFSRFFYGSGYVQQYDYTLKKRIPILALRL